MKIKRFLLALGATVGVSLAVVVAVPGASQTFPGRNGKIVVTDYRFYLISPDGTGLQELRAPYDIQYDPAWSPDGKRIAFTTGPLDYAGLAMINADGSGLRLFIKGVKHNTFRTCCVSWSPDGSRLAYSQDQGNDGNAVYVMDPKRSKTNSWGPVGKKVLQTGSPYADPVAWLSGTEVLVAVSNYDGKPVAYYAVQANGSGKRRVKAPWREGEPSPDRTMIAYVRWEKNGVYKTGWTRGAQSDIFVANADGSDARKLLGGPEDEDIPMWSPDGKKILYSQRHCQSGADLCTRTLWVVGVNGRGKKQVSPLPLESDFAAFEWQPLP
jgi:TolB protein